MQFAENFEEIITAFQKCQVDFLLSPYHRS